MKDVSLLIEGGGMRGFFSSGVLQCFLDNNIRIPYVIGISSGSLNALGYVTDNLGSFFDSAQDQGQRYIRLSNLKDLDRGLLDTERFFSPVAKEYEGLMASPAIMKVAATRARDAELVYWEKSEFRSPEDMVMKLKASAALPVLMPKTRVAGEVFVDGGIMDSIPVKEAERDGKTRHIVIVTRPLGYRKSKQSMELFLNKWLKPYPVLKEAMLTRHIRYNKTLEELETMEREGRAVIIHPVVNRLGRMEFNLEKFRMIYEDGYAIADQYLSSVRELLGEERPAPLAATEPELLQQGS